MSATSWASEHFQLSQARFAEAYQAYARDHRADYGALLAEHANLLLTVRWYLEQANRTAATDVVTTLSAFWLAHGYWDEAIRFSDAAVAQHEPADQVTLDDEHGLNGILLRVVGVSARWLQGRREAAQDMLGQLIATDQIDGDGSIKDVLGLLTGLMASVRGHSDETMGLYRAALERARTLRNPSALALALDLLAQALAAQGHTADAIALYQEKLQLLRESPEPGALVETLRGLAMIARSAGLSDLERSCLEEAAGLVDRTALPGLKRELLADRAAEAAQRADLDAATRLYREAIVLARSEDDQPSLANLLRRLAFIEDEQRRDPSGLLVESLSISRGLGDAAGMARSLIQLGEMHRDRGELDRARRCFDEATEIAARLGDPALEALACEGVADLAFDRSDWDEAARTYSRSHTLHEGGQQPAGQARTLHRLGQSLAAMGLGNEAAVVIQAAMAINEHLDDREAYAAGLYALAHLAVDAGKIEEAHRLGEAAVEILIAIGSDRAPLIQAELATWSSPTPPGSVKGPTQPRSGAR